MNNYHFSVLIIIGAIFGVFQSYANAGNPKAEYESLNIQYDYERPFGLKLQIAVSEELEEPFIEGNLDALSEHMFLGVPRFLEIQFKTSSGKILKVDGASGKWWKPSSSSSEIFPNWKVIRAVQIPKNRTFTYDFSLEDLMFFVNKTNRLSETSEFFRVRTEIRIKKNQSIYTSRPVSQWFKVTENN